MAFQQRVSKLTLMPAGTAVAAAATSLFCGSQRYTSHATNQKVNQIASQHLSALASRANVSTYLKPAGYSQRQFTSTSIVKAEPAAVGKEAASVPGANTAKSKGFVEWYEGHLDARPVTTKAITGSILWGVGDAVAQVAPSLFAEESAKEEFKYDVPRTARAVTFGFAIHAPLSHLHFNFLEWMAVRGGFQGLSVTVFKTIMEQFVYWSWFSNSLYHGAMGAMQGMNPTQIYDRIADVLWDTQVAQWKFWIPVQGAHDFHHVL
eukprot:CCRYP_020793-RA/>CCRYP_020793-RA protein AED:0.41 eAED:0.41 QI:0/0.5/0.33/1/1/1/3/0/262